jgi:hypothetical protein
LALAQQLDPAINVTAEVSSDCSSSCSSSHYFCKTSALNEMAKCFENATTAISSGQYRIAISMLVREARLLACGLSAAGPVHLAEPAEQDVYAQESRVLPAHEGVWRGQ